MKWMPFLLAGVDSDGDTRELWIGSIEQARTMAGQVMFPDANGPAWTSCEIWGNHPITENWECLESYSKDNIDVLKLAYDGQLQSL